MTDFSYPKTYRLLTPNQFKAVFNNPIFKVHQTHMMAFASNAEYEHARLGMAITKKKLPTAVARNRVKRLIREQFRHKCSKLPAMDIVFILKRSTDELSNKEIDQQIANILQKVISKSYSHTS